jgi:ribosomal protein L21E
MMLRKRKNQKKSRDRIVKVLEPYDVKDKNAVLKELLLFHLSSKSTLQFKEQNSQVQGDIMLLLKEFKVGEAVQILQELF